MLPHHPHRLPHPRRHRSARAWASRRRPKTLRAPHRSRLPPPKPLASYTSAPAPVHQWHKIVNGRPIAQQVDGVESLSVANTANADVAAAVFSSSSAAATTAVENIATDDNTATVAATVATQAPHAVQPPLSLNNSTSSEATTTNAQENAHVPEPTTTTAAAITAATAAAAAISSAAATTARAVDAVAAVSVSLVAPPPLAPLTDSISSAATSTTHAQEDAHAPDSLAANTAAAAAAAAAAVVPTAVAAAATAAVDPALPVTTSPSLHPLTNFSSSTATPETHAHTDARAAPPASAPPTTPTAPPTRPAPLLPLFLPTAEGKPQLVVLAHNHPAYHRLANTYTDRVLWIYANIYPDFYCLACYGPRFKGTHCHNCQCRCSYEVIGNHASLTVSAKHPTHCICDASHVDWACPNCSARLVYYSDLHPQPPCAYCNCTNNNADSDDCNDCQHNLSGDAFDWMIANERFVKINLSKKTLASGYPNIQVDRSGLERPDAWPMVHRVLQQLAQAPEVQVDSSSSDDSRSSTPPPPMPTMYEDTDEEKH